MTIYVLNFQITALCLFESERRGSSSKIYSSKQRNKKNNLWEWVSMKQKKGNLGREKRTWCKNNFSSSLGILFVEKAPNSLKVWREGKLKEAQKQK